MQKPTTTSIEEVFLSIEMLHSSQIKWASFELEERIEVIKDIKEQLLSGLEKYAKAISLDMNKPISQALAEVKKCATLCDYYITQGPGFLAPQHVKTQWSESYVTFEPLGVLLGVMPWNYPFWQVFRFVIPSLLLGNTFAVKHASNVPKSAQFLEEIFNSKKIDFPVYKNLFLKSEAVAEVIAHPLIKAISLTGSEPAGRSVAEHAGKHLKKCVLELGGSNAFIVLEDADLEKTLDIAVNARMQNAGQSCIAAKRFLVHQSLEKAFIEGLKNRIKQLKTGDKLDPATEIGAMAREDLAEELHELVTESISLGAQLELGGSYDGCFYQPTLLSKVTHKMPVFTNETFGPVAVVTSFSTKEEAYELSNSSNFGLGVSIFTKNTEQAKKDVSQFHEGAVFINEMVISDPNMPFGGVKNSGYGRELSHFALYEFANIKSVIIK